jgi:aryl-alcohol dehydrogenase-like predicted oxidoreductase
MEYSLQSREIEKEMIATCRELGVGIVAYSPLGRGFLSATFSSLDDLSENDWRRSQPRFSAENFAKNVRNEFFEYAKKKNCTPAQLALAWLHSQGDDIFPIPGTKDINRIEENFNSLRIRLTPVEAKEVSLIVPLGEGERYSAEMTSSQFDKRDNL